MNSPFSAPAHGLRAAGKPRSVAPRDRFFFPTKPLLKSLALALALSAAPEAMAVDRWFDCATGSMQTATCWSSNIKPVAADTAFIGYSSYAANVTASLTSGTFAVTSEYIGHSGYNGTVNHSAGSNTVNNSGLYLGYNAGITGTYNLSGTGTLTVVGQNGTTNWLQGLEYIGYNGTGIFNQTGGVHTHNSSGLMLGYNTGSTGSYNLQDGSLLTGVQYIGYNGIGNFNQSGGTHTSGTTYMGYFFGSIGNYNL